MKTGWQIVKIGEVCEIVNGGTPKTGVAEYWNGYHRWITPSEMGKRVSPYVDNTERKLTNKGLDNSSARMLPPFSVILSSRAPIGHLVINTEPMSTNQGCKGLVPKKQLDYKFLYYYLYSNVGYLNDLGSGTTFKELSSSKLKEVKIPLPPLPEQQRIVAILDEAFAAIETAKANTEQNLQNARELFERYLGNIFSICGNRWVKTTIGEHIRFIDYRGHTPTKTESGMTLITAKNVKMGYLQEEPREYVSPEIYQTWMTRGIPKRGDILFTTEAPLANIAQLDTEEKVVFAQRIIIMHPDPKILDATFLKYLLLSAPIQKRIHQKGTGATVKGIKAKLLKTVEIAYPQDKHEQQEIAERLDDLTFYSQRLQSIYLKKFAALDKLKQSLLHQAFSGEL